MSESNQSPIDTKATSLSSENQVSQPEIEIGSNPYNNSKALQNLEAQRQNNLPLRMAFLDIDSTLTGDPAKQTAVRTELEKQGYTVAFVSSRVYEMMMSQEQRDKSRIEDLRPVPKLKTSETEHVIDNVREKVKVFQEAHPNELLSFSGLLDSEFIIDGTGSNILVQQNEGGYRRDTDFQEKLRTASAEWRKQALQLVEELNLAITKDTMQALMDGKSATHIHIPTMPPIEDQVKFAANEADVFPPDHRIQLNFQDQKSKDEFVRRMNEEKLSETLQSDSEIVERIKQLKIQNGEKNEYEIDGKRYSSEGVPLSTNGKLAERPEGLLNIRVTDDSKPSEGRFQVYLTPNRGYKARAVEESFQKLITAYNNKHKDTPITASDFDLLFAGDSWPDLKMGLLAGMSSKATFLLAGGSRLTPKNEQGVAAFPDEFAGEGMTAVNNRMTQLSQPGEYSFKPPLGTERTVIIGDERYKGTKTAETILSYLQDHSS